MLKLNDFIFLIEDYSDLEKNSVGFIKSINASNAKVFFIGKNKEIELGLSKISYLDITKTGKPYPNKICNVCHVIKEDYKDFDINQTDASGRKTTRPTCKKCRELIDGKPLLESDRKRMNENKPNKFFVCPICKKPSIPFITANLVIDHNHHSGNAREWICDSCNTGLGRFKDNINLLKEAIKYLKKHDHTD